MANTSLSSRGSSWRAVLAKPAFKAGYREASAGSPPMPNRDPHWRDAKWVWWYELGRLLGAHQPGLTLVEGGTATFAALNAVNRAVAEGAFPIHRRR